MARRSIAHMNRLYQTLLAYCRRFHVAEVDSLLVSQVCQLDLEDASALILMLKNEPYHWQGSGESGVILVPKEQVEDEDAPTTKELSRETKKLAMQALRDGEYKVLPAAISAFLTSWDESTVAAALDKAREEWIAVYRERLKPLLTSEQIKQLEQEVRVATAKIHLD